MVASSVAQKSAQASWTLQLMTDKFMNNNSEQAVSTVDVKHKSNVLLPLTSVNNVTIVIIEQLSP
jgi:hypothetical protein